MQSISKYLPSFTIHHLPNHRNTVYPKFKRKRMKIEETDGAEDSEQFGNVSKWNASLKEGSKSTKSYSIADNSNCINNKHTISKMMENDVYVVHGV